MTIKEYWNIIGRDPFLAITWETNFYQACCFCRMLMSQMNFRFTPISDKTNDEIFLKSPKTLFFIILVIFARWRIFPKKSGFVTQNFIWTPNAMLSFRKNQWANSEKTYGQTEGWTDRLYFTGPFQPWPGVR